MKIRVDLDLCIGAGTCTVVAPKTFELDDELKVIPTKLKGNVPDPRGNDKDTIIEAAKVFPSLHHNS